MQDGCRQREHSDDDVHTVFSAKRPLATLVEEGIREKAPSSSEISFPAEPQALNMGKRHAYYVASPR